MRRVDVKMSGGYAPDLDIRTPGIAIAGDAYLPTVNGIGNVKSLISVGMDALAAACRGAVVARKIDDSRRVIASTATKLYEANGTSWTDRSKGAGSYAGAAEAPWRFTQFGNDTIATNKADPVQVSASGAFADLGGSPPKASIAETSNGFVLLFDYNDGVNDYNDGWFTSALEDDTDWTPDVDTGCQNGRLLETPGAVRASKKLGSVMVAYKERSMYMGFYDGPLWRWQLISSEIGCVSQEAIQEVIIDGVPCHIFLGFDGFYLFDGTRPRFIGLQVKNYFQTFVSAQYRYKAKSSHDPLAQNVYFYLPDSTGALTLHLAYNYRSGRWGPAAQQGPAVEAAMQYLAAGMTYESLGTSYSTYQDLPTNIAFDSPFWTSGAPVPAIFKTDHTLYGYTGTGGQASVVMSFIGDADGYRTLTRLRPLFNIYPSGDASSRTADAGTYYTANIGTSLSDPGIGQTIFQTMSRGKIDLMQSSKWFAPFFNFYGDWELSGYLADFEDDGEE